MPYITPRYEFAQPHADGTALVFSRDIDETAASIARFSARDARVFREWNARAEEMTEQVFMVERFRSAAFGGAAGGNPEPERGRARLLRAHPAPAHRRRQRAVENERVKVLFCSNCRCSERFCTRRSVHAVRSDR